MKRGMQQLIGIGLAFAACNATAGKFVERQHERIVEGRYIVAYEDQDAEIADMISQRLMDASRANGFRVEQTWKDAVYGAVISGLDDEKARQIAKMPGIEFVKNDTYMTLDTIQMSPPSWGIDRIDQRSLPLSASYEYSYVGNGIRVYLLDTPIETTNPEFNNLFGGIGSPTSRATNVYNAYSGPPCTGWVNTQHGTAMASIIGSQTYGVAKNVIINGIRVTDCAHGPTVPESAVISGLNWVVANGTLPAVINLSISFIPFDPLTSLLDNAVMSAYGAGYFLSKAAGNDESVDACLQQPTSGMETALYTAAASDEFDNFALAFSASGSCVDIIAPGVGVNGVIGTGTSAYSNTGTSPSAALVSGAAALIYNQFPTYTPAQVASLLTSRATSGAISSVPTGTVNLLLYTAP